MTPGERAVRERGNLIAGEWRSSAASFTPSAALAGEAWPQSSLEDVLLALAAGRSGELVWRRSSAGERAEFLRSMARALEDDARLFSGASQALALPPEEWERHRAGIGEALEAECGRARSTPGGLALVACDWRELVRDLFLEVARELLSARAVVLVSDEKLPELGARLAAAAEVAGLPPGVLGVLHGFSRELLGLALSSPASDEPQRTLVASGGSQRIIDLRRLCEAREIRDPRLRSLRCGAYALDPARGLPESAAEVVELAFGRATTLTGQLPGALGRVHCPERLYSRFSELLLETLESSPAGRSPLPQIDAAAAGRARASWALGLDEGATLIAGGDEESQAGPRSVPPTVFTNVEPFMASARRQEPVPVLCMLRGS